MRSHGLRAGLRGSLRSSQGNGRRAARAGRRTLRAQHDRANRGGRGAGSTGTSRSRGRSQRHRCCAGWACHARRHGSRRTRNRHRPRRAGTTAGMRRRRGHGSCRMRHGGRHRCTGAGHRRRHRSSGARNRRRNRRTGARDGGRNGCAGTGNGRGHGSTGGRNGCGMGRRRRTHNVVRSGSREVADFFYIALFLRLCKRKTPRRAFFHLEAGREAASVTALSAPPASAPSADTERAFRRAPAVGAIHHRSERRRAPANAHSPPNP